MAVRNLPVGQMIYPDPGNYLSGVWTTSSNPLDADGEYDGMVYNVSKAGTITKIGIPIANITTAGEIDVRLETVNTSTGHPTGTLWAANTNYRYTLVDPDDANTYVWITFTASATVTVGQTIALVIRVDATSTPNFQIRTCVETNGLGNYSISNFGTPTKNDLYVKSYLFEYSDGSHPNLINNRVLIHSATTANAHTTSYIATKFKLPWDALVTGFYTQQDQEQDYTITLWGEDGFTSLMETTHGYDECSSASGAVPMFIPFPAPIWLKANTYYRVSYRQAVSGGNYTRVNQHQMNPMSNNQWIPEDVKLADPFFLSIASSLPTSEDDWLDTPEYYTPLGVIISHISEPRTEGIAAGDIYAPYWATYQSGAPSFGSLVVDADTEKAGYVVVAPKTGTISKVHVCCSSVVVVPGADYDVRLETVGTSDGLPTGTLFDTNTNGALTIITGDDDEWLSVTLTAGASVTRGDDIFAVVLEPPASPDNGNIYWVNYTDGSSGLPYTVYHNGTIWTKVAGAPFVLLEYSDTTIPRIPNCFPWTQILYLSGLYSDSSWPHTGNRFKLREPAEIVGAWFQGDMDAADVTVTLYEGDSTVKRTLTLKKHHTGGTGGGHTQYAGYFSTPFNASADTLYRIGIKNNYAAASGTPLLFVRNFIAPTAIVTKIWDHMPYAGLFSEIYNGQSQDLSSWADTEQYFGMIGPIIRSIG